jgi:hypothetical protein
MGDQKRERSPVLGLFHAPLGIITAIFLEYFSNDGDRRVDGIRDDKDERLGGDLCNPGRQVLDDTTIDLERKGSDFENPIGKA